MDVPFAELGAVIRAMGGESDLTTLIPVLGHRRFARVVALAQDTHPIVRFIAALHGNLTSLPALHSITVPAIHDVVGCLIGTPTGGAVLEAWAETVHAGQGNAYATDLIACVKNGTCAAGVAAALLGPCDESAALLETPKDIAFAIRRWGQSAPDTPTAWISHLSPPQQERLARALVESPFYLAWCLPWMAPEQTAPCNPRGQEVTAALNSFAMASPAARFQHADLLAQIVSRARIEHLDALMRLALVMETDAIWSRVHGLLHEHPNAAFIVAAAAPWDALPTVLHDDIAALAPHSPVCTAIIAARGHAHADPDPAYATAFFAALDPAVWDSLAATPQQQWRRLLHCANAYLAVRSLGLRPEMLACARLDDDLIAAVRRHAHDPGVQRAALFPVALRDLDPDQLWVLITALPTLPRDSGAFFCIAGGGCDPRVIARADAALQTPDDLGAAVIMQRCADDRYLDHTTCTALATALHGRTWDDLAPILALLDDRAHANLMPDRDALIARLARPDRRDAIRSAMDVIVSLPPEVAIPTLVALRHWMTGSVDVHILAECMRHAFRLHGTVFLTVVDALADDHLRTILLPLPDHPPLADALRHLARSDPVIAHRLAHAIRMRSWRDVCAALCAAAHDDAHTAFMALPDAVQSAIVADIEATFLSIACVERTDELRVSWRSIVRTHPLAAIALAALAFDDPDDRGNAARILEHYPAIIRVFLPLLHPDHGATLRARDAVRIAIADLESSPPDHSCVFAHDRARCP